MNFLLDLCLGLPVRPPGSKKRDGFSKATVRSMFQVSNTEICLLFFFTIKDKIFSSFTQKFKSKLKIESSEKREKKRDFIFVPNGPAALLEVHDGKKKTKRLNANLKILPV